MLEKCRMQHAEGQNSVSGQRTERHASAGKEERVESDVEVEHDVFIGQASTPPKTESIGGQEKEWWEVDPDEVVGEEEQGDEESSDDESESGEESSSEEEDDDDDDSSDDDEEEDGDEDEDEGQSNGFGYQLRRC